MGVGPSCTSVLSFSPYPLVALPFASSVTVLPARALQAHVAELRARVPLLTGPAAYGECGGASTFPLSRGAPLRAALRSTYDVTGHVSSVGGYRALSRHTEAEQTLSPSRW